MASAMTGAGGTMAAICFGGCLPVVMVSPVAMGSSLPSATVSPPAAAPRFSVAAPVCLNTPATRAASPLAPVTVAPSPISPVSTRVTDSLPPWAVCSVFIT